MDDSSVELLKTFSLPLVLLVITLFIFIKNVYKYSSLPGPWGLPFLGYTTFIGPDTHVKMTELSKTYGKLFVVNMFGCKYVIINDYELAKEALVTKGDNFSRKPEGRNFIRSFFGPKSLFLTNADHWKVHRKLFVQMVINQGIGKPETEDRMKECIQELLDYTKSTNEEAIDFAADLKICLSNVYTPVLFSKKFERDSPDFLGIRSNFTTMFRDLDVADAFAYGWYSWIFKGLFLGKRYFERERRKNRSINLVSKILADRLSEEDTEYEDYIKYFVDEMKKGDKHFDKETLLSNVMETLYDSTDGLGAAMRGVIYAMARYPEFQAKVQKEINEFIGKERLPQFSDKASLNYSQAVINEALRFYILQFSTPLGLAKSNNENGIIGGFFIPKHTNLLVNYFAIARDPKYFKNPDNFDPENFLEDGVFTPNERSRPFGLGKRTCVGEAYSRKFMLLMLTAILQNYSIEPPPGMKPEDLSIFNFKCCLIPKTW